MAVHVFHSLTVFFSLSGSSSIKAARKMLMKLSPDHPRSIFLQDGLLCIRNTQLKDMFFYKLFVVCMKY